MAEGECYKCKLTNPEARDESSGEEDEKEEERSVSSCRAIFEKRAP